MLLLAMALAPCPRSAAAEPAMIIAPASPPEGEQLRAMQRWHATYRERTAEVQRCTAQLNQALNRKYPDLSLPCGQLGSALADRKLGPLFPVPDRATDLHLRAAFGALRHAARACRADRPTELIYRLQQARDAFGNAELALRRYRLRP